MIKPRSIFVKIYLWFWFTTAIIILGQISLDRAPGFGPPPHHRMHHTLDAALAIYGKAVLEYYSHGDGASLASMASQIKDSTGVDVYLFNSEKVGIDGRVAPENAIPLLESAARSRRPEPSFEPDKLTVAQIITGTDGKEYGVIGVEYRPEMDSSLSGSARAIIRILTGLLLAGIVCYWLANHFSSPLIKLRDATRRFAKGELDTRIGNDMGARKDEISELAEDFDQMAEHIESLMTSQRQLLRDISHELRSPLARLNVALELARKKTGNEAEKALDRIKKEADELNEMIGQLLTLTRMETSIGEIGKTSVSLSKLVDKIASDADYEAQGSGRSVIFNPDYDEFMVSGNEELLRRAIENVVRNAIRYTKEGTVVNIHLRRVMKDSRTMAEIIVRDHGEGAPEKDLGNLFRPFYRVSDARERQTGGTGIGLAITERAVSLHHGAVSAINAEGGGLEVLILLPLAKL